MLSQMMALSQKRLFQHGTTLSVDGGREILSLMPAGLSQSRPLVLTYSGQKEGWDLAEKAYSSMNVPEISYHISKHLEKLFHYGRKRGSFFRIH